MNLILRLYFLLLVGENKSGKFKGFLLFSFLFFSFFSFCPLLLLLKLRGRAVRGAAEGGSLHHHAPFYLYEKATSAVQGLKPYFVHGIS